MSLPEPGDLNWGSPLNDAILAAQADAASAKADASSARSTAIDAHATAQSVKEFVEAPTDEQIAAKVAEADSASQGAVDDRIDAKVPAATEGVAGKVPLATEAEAATGTETAKAVTPAGVKAAVDPIRDLTDETFAANLSASTVPKWKPSTAYTAGDVVMAPDGSIVKRLTSGTSGSSYTSTNWQTVATVTGTQAQTELAATYIGAVIATGTGIDPTGVADSSAAIQAKIDAAIATSGVLAFPPGTYRVDNLLVRTLATAGTTRTAVKFVGMGSDSSRFLRTNSSRYGGVTLKRTSGSTNPLITIDGPAHTVDNIVFDGNSGTGDVVKVNDAFEFRARAMRIVNGAGCGLNLIKSNNLWFEHVMVDNCGSSTKAAVKIGGVNSGGEVNTLDLNGLTIERQANVALEVGYGTDAANGEYAEFIRIDNLHVEAATDNGGSTNTDPLVRFGNIRSVCLVNPFIYGGPGPLISHEQQAARSAPMGGLVIIGGTLLGHTTTSGGAGAVPPYLIQLTNGDGFSMIGTRLDQCDTAAVNVASTYGANVFISTEVLTTSRVPTLITDARATKNPTTVNNDFRMRSATGPRIFELDTPSAQTGNFRWSTNGVGRWDLRKDTVAETGSTAGGNLELVARADNGTNLGTLVTFIRSSQGVRFENKSIGFFGTTPITKPTGLPANATDLASAIELVNDIKSKLMSLGLMTT